MLWSMSPQVSICSLGSQRPPCCCGGPGARGCRHNSATWSHQDLLECGSTVGHMWDRCSLPLNGTDNVRLPQFFLPFCILRFFQGLYSHSPFSLLIVLRLFLLCMVVQNVSVKLNSYSSTLFKNNGS